MLEIEENVLKVAGEFGAGIHVVDIVVFCIHELLVGFCVGTPREINLNKSSVRFLDYLKEWGTLNGEIIGDSFLFLVKRPKGEVGGVMLSLTGVGL